MKLSNLPKAQELQRQYERAGKRVEELKKVRAKGVSELPCFVEYSIHDHDSIGLSVDMGTIPLGRVMDKAESDLARIKQELGDFGIFCD